MSEFKCFKPSRLLFTLSSKQCEASIGMEYKVEWKLRPLFIRNWSHNALSACVILCDKALGGTTEITKMPIVIATAGSPPLRCIDLAFYFFIPIRVYIVRSEMSCWLHNYPFAETIWTKATASPLISLLNAHTFAFTLISIFLIDTGWTGVRD